MILEELEEQLEAITSLLSCADPTYGIFFDYLDEQNLMIEESHGLQNKMLRLAYLAKQKARLSHRELMSKEYDLTNRIAKAKYALALGDLVDYTDFNGRQCSLIVEEISFYGKRLLCVRGKKINKSGLVGKMRGSFFIGYSTWHRRAERA